MRCSIRVHDPALQGHAAELRVVRRVVVHDDRPVNNSTVVLQRKIEQLQAVTQFEIHRANLEVFSYSGSKIDVEVRSELKVDDGLIFDTTISEVEQMALAPRPQVTNDAKGVVEPADAFNFARNLAALSPVNRGIVMMLALVGSLVIGINSLVGVHDQFAPDPAIWFYDHYDSDGKGEMPFAKSLAGSGAFGAAIWFAIRRQLRKYMTFELHDVPGRICRGDRLRAGALLRGRSRVTLENTILRVVACNMELGQYKRGSGTNERTVSFKEPVRAVVLYEQKIPRIAADVPVEQYFTGEISFEPMFRALYPPQMAGTSHGLSVHWEVQLINEDFVDQELIGPIDCFPWKDFVSA